MGSSVVREAADWVADEENAWSSFANNVLRDGPSAPVAPPPLQQQVQPTQSRDLGLDLGGAPTALNSLGQLRDLNVPAFTTRDLIEPAMKLDDHINADGLMDLVDAD